MSSSSSSSISSEESSEYSSNSSLFLFSGVFLLPGDSLLWYFSFDLDLLWETLTVTFRSRELHFSLFTSLSSVVDSSIVGNRWTSVHNLLFDSEHVEESARSEKSVCTPPEQIFTRGLDESVCVSIVTHLVLPERLLLLKSSSSNTSSIQKLVWAESDTILSLSVCTLSDWRLFFDGVGVAWLWSDLRIFLCGERISWFSICTFIALSCSSSNSKFPLSRDIVCKEKSTYNFICYNTLNCRPLFMGSCHHSPLI